MLAARSVRGAAFNNNDNRLRLANRNNNTPGNRNNNIGFRLVARIPLRPERPGPRAWPERPRGIQAGPRHALGSLPPWCLLVRWRGATFLPALQAGAPGAN